jgi:hypothetical protein
VILRFSSAVGDAASASGAWQAFEQLQLSGRPIIGCVTQPAHAALAGRLATLLQESLFGPLPAEVTDAIGRHDSGWAEADLAGLESARQAPPIGFLHYPAQETVEAWRNSIVHAERRSMLAGVLTRRHFCMLAAHDQQPAYVRFVEEESERQKARELELPVGPVEIGRYASALGFCDLLSLCLCSGLKGEFSLPLAHPAEAGAKKAAQVLVRLQERSLHFDRLVLRPGNTVFVDGWLQSDSGIFASARLDWEVG